MTDTSLRRSVGFVAIGASTVHSLTDLMEWSGGGFSTTQLGLNYVAFAAVPFAVPGIFVSQRPRIALMAGVTTNLVVALAPLPPITQTLGSLVRDISFIGMGTALMRPGRPR